MIRLIPTVPVGVPGLVALGVGFVLFVAQLFFARARRAEDSGTGRHEGRSLAGIIVQGVGIFIGAVGPIDIGLPAASPSAIAQAALVAGLMAGTIGLFRAAVAAMGRNWAVVAQTRSDHELVTTGPFAHVRNPIYVALFLFMLAIAVAYGHYAGLAIGIPLYAVGTMMRVRIEERLLRAQFGAAYDAYAGRVKRFVPGVV